MDAMIAYLAAAAHIDELLKTCEDDPILFDWIWEHSDIGIDALKETLVRHMSEWVDWSMREIAACEATTDQHEG